MTHECIASYTLAVMIDPKDPIKISNDLRVVNIQRARS